MKSKPSGPYVRPFTHVLARGLPLLIILSHLKFKADGLILSNIQHFTRQQFCSEHYFYCEYPAPTNLFLLENSFAFFKKTILRFLSLGNFLTLQIESLFSIIAIFFNVLLPYSAYCVPIHYFKCCLPYQSEHLLRVGTMFYSSSNILWRPETDLWIYKYLPNSIKNASII